MTSVGEEGRPVANCVGEGGVIGEQSARVALEIGAIEEPGSRQGRQFIEG